MVFLVGVAMLRNILEVQSIEGVHHGSKLFSFGLVDPCPGLVDVFKCNTVILLVPNEVLYRNKHNEGEQSGNEV